MLNRAAAKDHQAGDLGPHIDDSTAIFSVIVGQYAFGGRKRFEHKLFDVDTGARHCFN